MRRAPGIFLQLRGYFTPSLALIKFLRYDTFSTIGWNQPQNRFEAMTETGQLLEQIFQIEEKGDIQTALEEAVKLRAAVQTDDPTHIPAVEATLARQMALLGRYAEARQHAEQSLQMAPEDPSAVNALIVLGISLAETNHPQEAEEYFQQAAELSRKSNDWLGLGRAMHNLATAVYLPQGKFDLAFIPLSV